MVLILEAADRRLDEIYRYTRDEWGEAQAEKYLTGLFECLMQIGSHVALSRPIPAHYGVEGFFLHYERHIIYWKRLENAEIGITSILHTRMHQVGRLREDFGL